MFRTKKQVFPAKLRGEKIFFSAAEKLHFRYNFVSIFLHPYAIL